MSPWEAAALGVLQGATEFLPVSSSGHLVLAQRALGVALPGVVFEVTLHIATLCSVLWAYRRRTWWLLEGALRGDLHARRYLALLAVATLPAALVGLGAGDIVKALFEEARIVGGALVVTGTALWVGAVGPEESQGSASEEAGAGSQAPASPSWRSALLIGMAQAFALVPGISRAGFTVVVALRCGLGGRDAARFSFFMAMPAIAGAAVLSIPEALNSFAAGQVPASGGLAGVDVAVAVGFVAAAATGVLAIRLLVSALARGALRWFAPYCWVLGGLTVLLS